MNKKQKRKNIKPAVIIIIAAVVLLIIAAICVGLFLRRDKHTAFDMSSVRSVQPVASSLNTAGSYYTYSDPSAGVASLTAIDVSAHQKEIDWENVKKNNIDAAYIRLGLRGYESGAVVLDDYFEKNISEAYDSDIFVGVYFFSQAINAEEAVEEADFVIENLKKHPIDLQVVYDFERMENETSRSSSANEIDVTGNAIAFCERIREVGYTPMIYMNAYIAANDYDISRLSGTDIWYANYNEVPDIYSSFAVWQYTNEGSLADGSIAPVDLNIMFVTDTD